MTRGHKLQGLRILYFSKMRLSEFFNWVFKKELYFLNPAVTQHPSFREHITKGGMRTEVRVSGLAEGVCPCLSPLFFWKDEKFLFVGDLIMS